MNWRRLLAIVLVLSFIFPYIAGCSENRVSDATIDIEQSEIYQEFIKQHNIDERYIQQEYIRQNLILEDSIYEIVLCDQFICQSYIVETKITKNSIEEIANQLPGEMENYDIDWPKVIAQFAVGTTVILVVGVVYHETKGQSYFLFGSPIEIAKEALIGGAIDATIAVMLNCSDEETPRAKTAKYAIEGFAEGYMYGAISGVVERIVKPNFLKSPTHGKLKIDNFGVVKNSAGKVVGKALYNTGEKTFTLIDDAGRAIGYFDNSGKALVDIVSEMLEPNSIFVQGFDDVVVQCFTDATGAVYRQGDNLIPNVTYILDGVKYQTDDLGRVVSASFEKLELKPGGRARKSLNVGIEVIGKGFEKTGDQRGHIIGDRFNGANSLANLVPMSPNLNQKEYKAIEDIWAEAIGNGKVVDGTIKLLYDGSSFRPSRLDITYLIDGIEQFVKLFN